MISLPSVLPWVVRISGEGEARSIILMASTREQAYLSARELYPYAVVTIVGVAPEWNNA